MSPAATAFAEELIAYWVSFVRSGNPNKYKLKRSPVWKQFTSSEKWRIVLQQGAEQGSSEEGEATMTTTTDVVSGSGSFLEKEGEDESARCEFVKSLVGVQQN